MERKKILPVKYPMISSYHTYAALMSVLQNYEEAMPWVHSKYVQIQAWDASPPMGHLVRELYWDNGCPFIRNQYIDFCTVVRKWGSINDFLIDFIDQGYYSFFAIEQHGIPTFNVPPGKVWSHQVFVYGYDLSEEVFYIADYISWRKYDYYTIKFSEMTIGFNNIDEIWYNHQFERNGIHLLKFIDVAKFDFSAAQLKKVLTDYYNGENNVLAPFTYTQGNDANASKHIFGIRFNQALIRYIEHIWHSGHTFIDFREFAVLVDHKRMMVARIKFLSENGYLKNPEKHILAYEEIFNKSQLLITLISKFNMPRGKPQILESIINNLTDIDDRERVALPCLIGDIFDKDVPSD